VSLSSHSLRFSTIIFNNTAADQNILSMASAGFVPEEPTEVIMYYFNMLCRMLREKLKKRTRIRGLDASDFVKLLTEWKPMNGRG